ncbi:FAD-dependent monooxygenase [Actinoplanes sp. NPDC049599]|uniref:FAD-dependent monooxygenase n=1 Tax=Actinoplanes sp. NPDC049599 TaxID=3363903 RepID=UPI003793F579
MPTPQTETTVLIVGAGPVGAVLAMELAHHGVRSVVVDRSPGPSRHPKMDFIHGRSMEHYRRLGLADPIRRHGVAPDHLFNFQWIETLDRPPVSVWEHPSVEQTRRRMAEVNDGTVPREPYQRVMGSRLEELGRRQLSSLALVDLREGWTFRGYTAEGDSVVAELAGPDGSHHVRARFLVGCDGANSTVRRAAGITVDDATGPVEHRDVFFRSTDPVLRRNGLFFLTVASRGLTLVSRDGDQLWTGTFPLFDAAQRDADPVAVLRERLGVDFAVDEVLVVAHWEGRLAVADAYRAGPVFIAGDAAHQFFPTGGHGANTGIGDAVNLGWKLAAVAQGWGGPALLESYEAERRPVGLLNREFCGNLLDVWRRYPALAAAGAGRARLTAFLERERYQIHNTGIHFGDSYRGSPVVAGADDAEPAWDWTRIVATTTPGWRLPSVRLDDGTELHDLLGPELTLLDCSESKAGTAIADEAAVHGIPLVHVAIEDPHVRSMLERPLVLVRPDQHVAWRGAAPADPGAVLDVVRGRREPGPGE